MKALAIYTCVALAIPATTGNAQGTFQNLDFEQAIVAGDPAPASTALPHWTVYVGLAQRATIFYDDVSLGSAAVSLHDFSSIFKQPLQGSYSVWLQGSGAGPATSAAIAQTGQLPADAASIRFRVSPLSVNFQVTIDGQSIPLSILSSTASYNILGGNISAFADQTREVRFIGLANGGMFFDDIQFSPIPVPEPCALALVGFGGLLFGVNRWRKSCQQQ